mmetsp:Transcript_138228/g.240531  ORF Transcript_138228/g.240531 Transcript_138228/m.240531 type:complete len:219 (+) Transcript_138228:1814-2470(+)
MARWTRGRLGVGDRGCLTAADVCRRTWGTDGVATRLPAPVDGATGSPGVAGVAKVNVGAPSLPYCWVIISTSVSNELILAFTLSRNSASMTSFPLDPSSERRSERFSLNRCNLTSSSRSFCCCSSSNDAALTASACKSFPCGSFSGVSSGPLSVVSVFSTARPGASAHGFADCGCCGALDMVDRGAGSTVCALVLASEFSPMVVHSTAICTTCCRLPA